MGLASLIVGLLLARRLHLSLLIPAKSELPAQILKEHWAYGRWAIATNVLGWVPGHVYYLFLPFWGGLEASAALKILDNLLQPVAHSLLALSYLLLPTFARIRSQNHFGSFLRSSLTLLCSIAILNWMIVGLFNYQIVTWLYGGRYGDYAHLLWLMGLAPVIASIIIVSARALCALERPDLVFWANVPSTVITLTVGLSLMITWGIFGVCIAGLLSLLASAAVMTWLLYSKVLFKQRVVATA